MKRHLFLTGPPGCGKTTVIHKLVGLLAEEAVPMYGFWTAEIREQGVRQGFEVELMSGQSGILAHVGIDHGPRVSKYRVNIQVMHQLVVPEIREAIESSRERDVVLLLDEIGKMELHSVDFREVLGEALASPLRAVATVMEASDSFVDPLKERPDTEVVHLGAVDRDLLPEQIARAVALKRDFSLLGETGGFE
jgi:nucleoside-triphosphatase